jgi:hypothetical protein|tara:strand:+ start:209 stop:580 length:372 start_codon:yes stop_codon:yes gene_type:complete
MIEKNIALPGNQYCQAVALVDTNGNTYLARVPPPATSVQTSVSSIATNSVILAANSARQGVILYNQSTAILYLLLSTGTSSLTNYSLQIPANGSLSLQAGEYTGVISGLWSAANGFARVTEFA